MLDYLLVDGGAQHTLGLALAWAVLPCQSQYILHLLVLLIGALDRRCLPNQNILTLLGNDSL
jgi:hypothetical protein